MDAGPDEYRWLEARMLEWRDRCAWTEEDLTAERARRQADLDALDLATMQLTDVAAERAEAAIRIADLETRLANAELLLSKRPTPRLRVFIRRWPRVARLASHMRAAQRRLTGPRDD